LGIRRNDEALRAAARAMDAAVDQALAKGEALTPDLGDKGTTKGFAAAVQAFL
jgi:isocitrate/isopropylmalate dehydrogenase